MKHSPETSDLDEILAGVLKISGHRQVLLRLHVMLEDPDCSSGDIVKVLQTDAGLASRVIAAANTTYFRGGSQVASALEAVVRVGAREIRRLLVDSLMHELALGSLPAYGIAGGTLWNHSLGVALAMDLLAGKVSRSPDICYTAGLMHTLGFVVVSQWVSQSPSLAPTRLGSIDAPDLERKEKELLGWSSAEIGAELLRRWRFPDAVVEAVHFQRHPEEAGRYTGIASLLGIACWLARTAQAGEYGQSLPTDPAGPVWEMAGLRRSDTTELPRTIRTMLKQAKDGVGVW